MHKYVGLSLTPTSSGSYRLMTQHGWARHDLHLDDTGNLAMVYETEAIGQHAKQRLKTYLGEWFLDIEVGVPWFQQIFVRPFNTVVSEALIKREILTTPGVVELMSFSMFLNNWFRGPTGALRDARHLDVARADVRSEFDEVIEI